MAEEAKARIAETVKEAFTQFTEGCGRPVCFNKDCFNYPFEVKPLKTQAAIVVFQRFRNKGDASERFCFCQRLPNMTEGAISEVKNLELTFKNLDVLGASFLQGKVTPTDPAIDFSDLAATYSKAQELIHSKELSEDWLLQCVENLDFERTTEFARLFLPRAIMILLEMPDLLQPEMTETLLRIAELGIDYYERIKVQIVDWLRGYSRDHLLRFIYPFQQFITLRICDNKDNSRSADVITIVRLLDLINQANYPLELVSYKEFYNDAVNKEADMQHLFINFMEHREEPIYDPENFSLMFFPWILDSSRKSELLHFESIVQQRFSQRQNFRDMIQLGVLEFIPYLLLEVHRENLIQDTLTHLVHGEDNLKKPLKVHFINEEGIDGGGVQKEFFQLIVRELFDPKFSMFTYYEDTRYFWFNPDTMAQDDEFELVGMILGLAIYNCNIIDVHLPLAAYKKLCGARTTIEDLSTFDPVLAHNLKETLVLEGDIESILCRSFDIETTPYGEPVHHELKPNGMQIPVTGENRAEYVDLYVDWVLNKSGESRFEAFRQGFLKVCGGYVMKMFRAEELELLVCGNPVLDFYELERACIYEDGYTKDSRTCQLFWKVLHSLTEDQKKKFLFFVTGSDRAPINGLGSLRFVVSRNGPDSDRLMTAHTCFNHLLLPEYKSEKKIKEMLLLAINNSEGFGLR